MKGKDKCEFLKGIRKRMAEANGIPYEPRECTYEGDCTGTCPSCEKETAELLAALKKKKAEGKEIKKDDFCMYDDMDQIEKSEEVYVVESDSPLRGDISDDEHKKNELRKLQEELIREEMENNKELRGSLVEGAFEKIEYDEEIAERKRKENNI